MGIFFLCFAQDSHILETTKHAPPKQAKTKIQLAHFNDVLHSEKKSALIHTYGIKFVCLNPRLAAQIFIYFFYCSLQTFQSAVSAEIECKHECPGPTTDMSSTREHALVHVFIRSSCTGNDANLLDILCNEERFLRYHLQSSDYSCRCVCACA